MTKICPLVIPPTSCAKSQLLLATQLLGVLIVPCNAWLFLLRVRSIPAYPGSRVIVLICGVLWLMTCSSALMFRAFKAPEIHLGNGTCILVPEFDGSFLSVPLISTVAFDTATMIAISLGFVMNSPNPTWRSRIKSIIFVGDVGKVSGALLRSGRLYYLYVISHLWYTQTIHTYARTFCSATIGVHLSMTIITLGTSISPPYICQLSILTGVFQTIMTCRVFRLLRLTNRSELENHSSVLVTDSTVLFGTSSMSDQSDPTLR